GPRLLELALLRVELRLRLLLLLRARSGQLQKLLALVLLRLSAKAAQAGRGLDHRIDGLLVSPWVGRLRGEVAIDVAGRSGLRLREIRLIELRRHLRGGQAALRRRHA